MTKIPNSYFKLFACCIAIKGARRSLICDLQRDDTAFIPNDLFDILAACKTKTIKEIKSIYGKENEQTIDDYLDFLHAKEFGFYTETPEWFPEMDLHWNEPAKITNAIIDSDRNSNFNFKKLLGQLEDLGCRHIQFRFYDVMETQALERLLELTKDSTIKSIEMALKYSEAYTFEYLGKLCEENERIYVIYLYSSPQNGRRKILVGEKDNDSSLASIVYSKKDVIPKNDCGLVSEECFTVGIKHFTEAQKYNTCLNRKISVDPKGEIRNCPSCKTTFGNIRAISLKEAMDKPGFQEVWHINKNQIDICKDCEFRYICTDCRAFIQDEKDIYSKPSKCSYDPYTATWGKG